MPKSIILHIGPNKTGTSYIQREFSATRALLQERADIVYPVIEHDPRFGHHDIAVEFRREGHSKTLAKLLETCSQAHHLLLSSESFSKLEGTAIAGLAKQLAGHEVTVAYAVRKPIELLFSTWQQKIKVGSYLTWSEFFVEQLGLGAASSLLNPDVTIAEYLKHLPDCQLRLMDYSGAMAAKKNIANLLIEATLGVELPEFSAVSNNVSLEPDHAEILRALNARYWQEAGVPAKGFRVHSAARKKLKRQPDLFEPLKSRIEKFSHEVDVYAVADACTKHYLDFVKAHEADYRGPRDPGTVKKKLVALPASCWIQDAETLVKLDAIYAQLPIRLPAAARRRRGSTSASSPPLLTQPPENEKAARKAKRAASDPASAEKKATRQAARKLARVNKADIKS